VFIEPSDAILIKRLIENDVLLENYMKVWYCKQFNNNPTRFQSSLIQIIPTQLATVQIKFLVIKRRPHKWKRFLPVENENENPGRIVQVVSNRFRFPSSRESKELLRYSKWALLGPVLSIWLERDGSIHFGEWWNPIEVRSIFKNWFILECIEL